MHKISDKLNNRPSKNLYINYLIYYFIVWLIYNFPRCFIRHVLAMQLLCNCTVIMTIDIASAV